MENIPFHTVDLEWQLSAPPAEGEGEDRDWKEIYQQLLLNIRQLMETLRGEEAP